MQIAIEISNNIIIIQNTNKSNFLVQKLLAAIVNRTGMC